MSLDKATVARIAHLARIRVPEADQDALVGELNQLLGWVEQLGEVDTKGVEPMTGVVAMRLPMRADVVSDGGRAENVLANAPEGQAGFFVVPKVVE
ncbi:MAG TPA: Asp-tRNA(Asn)/Glu-tRNA(Gln) amidotransferase subunit GatC [Azospirillaceae bacterium]|nr:Asp-tRNA(Asn)/Glu-tRNA(Gln) amidotransferase subunit GatC [Azospirillaceae bacterium]